MQDSQFFMDQRILDTCFLLGDWSLSSVLLKNNANYPWLILVPRIADIQEIDEIPANLRPVLMDEITQLSSVMRAYFKPYKLNIGFLGNIVSQLHIHVIGRFTTDKLWPHSIWQAALDHRPYSDDKVLPLVDDLRAWITDPQQHS